MNASETEAVGRNDPHALARLYVSLRTAPRERRLELLSHARELALASGRAEAVWRIELAARAERGEESARVLRLLELRLSGLAPDAVGELAGEGKHDSVEVELGNLMKAWRADNEFTSSMTRLVLHPAYQRIIGLGKPAVRLLLRELAAEPSHLGWALQAITGANPVSPEDAGRVDRIAKAWIRWGRDNGYLE